MVWLRAAASMPGLQRSNPAVMLVARAGGHELCCGQQKGSASVLWPRLASSGYRLVIGSAKRGRVPYAALHTTQLRTASCVEVVMSCTHAVGGLLGCELAGLYGVLV